MLDLDLFPSRARIAWSRSKLNHLHPLNLVKLDRREWRLKRSSFMEVLVWSALWTWNSCQPCSSPRLSDGRLWKQSWPKLETPFRDTRRGAHKRQASQTVLYSALSVRTVLWPPKKPFFNAICPFWYGDGTRGLAEPAKNLQSGAKNGW